MPRKIGLSAARKAGLKHYFTGKPCKRGHVARRHVSSRACMVCALAAVLAHSKTPKGRRWRKKYRRGENLRRANATPAARACRSRYLHSPKGHEAQWRYNHSPKGNETRRNADLRHKASDHGRRADDEYARREDVREARNRRKRKRLIDRLESQAIAGDINAADRLQNLITRRRKEGKL